MNNPGSSTRRLLFLAYYFPPLRTVASVRTSAMAKYLSRLGWDVTVVTPSDELWRVVDDVEKTKSMFAQEGIKRILTGHSFRLLLPHYLKCSNQGLGYLVGGVCRKAAWRLGLEREVGWSPHVRRACQHLRPGEFDVVLASGGPFISFTLAEHIAAQLHCPFVLDYRDLWLGDPQDGRPQPRRAFIRERMILDSCARATIISPSLGNYVAAAHGIPNEFQVVSNGFDYEELKTVQPATFDHFAIVYGGIFYPPDRAITPVMRALQRIKQNTAAGQPEWRFHYYGNHAEHVVEKATEFGVMDRVTLHGFTRRSEVLSAIRGANIAVVIASLMEEAPLEYRGIVTGKFFEPIGLGTPVLLVAPRQSDAAEIVRATQAGGHFTGNEVEAMAHFLSEAMVGRLRKPRIPLEYSWNSLAAQMDGILRASIREGKIPTRDSVNVPTSV